MESADYDTSNNYSGYRVDFNINPDKSNWYFDVGFRQREHDNKIVISVMIYKVVIVLN
ncbi:hypothetical protein ACU42Y_17940 [Proteus mirabilis]